ncbi:MAG TPA: hypothetical protein VLR26_16495 [Frankiaceae bacterium]|nr:hypothetical protein [Frankiaceae bacterium]
MQLRTEPLLPEYRFVLTSKLDQAGESGDAALLTAAVLTTGMIVGLRLIHASVPSIVVLAVPMMLSGFVTYLHCRRRMRSFQHDLDEATVVAGSAHTKLTRLEGSAEGSFSLRLPDRTVRAYNKGAGLRSVLLKPDPGTFSGAFTYAPHSGQLLRLADRSGRSIFDAAATELNETFDFSELENA